MGIGKKEPDITTTSATIVGPLGAQSEATSLATAPATDARYQISKNTTANAVDNTIFVELSDGSAAFLDSTAAPGYIRLQDGDSTVLGDILDDMADGQATTLNALWVGAVAFGYNETGSDLNMLRINDEDNLRVAIYGNDGSNDIAVKSDSSGNVYVIQAALQPGQDEVNDWIEMLLSEIATYSPAKTAGTAVNGAYDIVLQSVSTLGLTNITISIVNLEGGSGDVLDSFKLEQSPDNTNWGKVAEETGKSWAAANGVYTFTIDHNSYRYIRASAACAAGDTTCDAWITANKG